LNGRRALLGATLRKVRLERGLTQVQLAEASGIGQAWISRIESGRTIPEAKTIEQLAAALHLVPQVREALLAEASELRAELAEWPSVAQEGMRQRQERIRGIEASASEIRVFQPAIVPGLLQLPAYARQIFAAGQEFTGASDAQEATQARADRQQILFDASKRFVLLMTEQALRWRIGPAATMAAQVERIASALGQENVTIGLIPFTEVVPLPPLHTFTIYDARLVMLEALDDVLILYGETDAALYGRLFEAFGRHALWGTDTRPLLEAARRDFLRS
jgi:transcriptional regulator with XRE-family HTH domain